MDTIRDENGDYILDNDYEDFNNCEDFEDYKVDGYHPGINLHI